MRPKVDVLDTFMFLLCGAYSALLEASDNKARLEPDFIWLEVVIGNLLILVGGAALRVRLQQERGDIPTWRDYERGVARAFIAGGLPVILWQFWQAAVRHERARAYLRGDDSSEYNPEALAEEC